MEPRKIVRFLATDLPGNLAAERALRRIKGIGKTFSHALCLTSKVDPKKKIGLLSDSELQELAQAITNPTFPRWMLNRRRDPETGTDLHFTGSILDLRQRDDINTLRRIRAYRGVRHSLGQPVRGQRTRSSFRTQKSVGVMKKAARAAQKPAASAPKQEAKK